MLSSQMWLAVFFFLWKKSMGYISCSINYIISISHLYPDRVSYHLNLQWNHFFLSYRQIRWVVVACRLHGCQPVLVDKILSLSLNRAARELEKTISVSYGSHSDTAVIGPALWCTRHKVILAPTCCKYLWGKRFHVTRGRLWQQAFLHAVVIFSFWKFHRKILLVENVSMTTSWQVHSF